MPYAEIRPTAALQPWVDCFWTNRDEACEPRQHRVLPDGCADLVFDLSAGEADVVGTMTRPLIITGDTPANYFGVRFRPGRAAAFLRIPLAELTDARVSLHDVWRGFRGEWSIASLETELLKRLDPDRDRRVDYAIERIVHSGGAVRVDAVADEAGISRQHLARQFRHHVGVSPKMLARVMRFRGVVDAVGREADWADLAAKFGYYDQSHLIADFRELAGTTPNAFLSPA
ncbi:MAG TPA: helix-turn-helix domain-containing protein [Thermoanaerobaculia bacterium]|nr:helix-turn-helix domain-containing protein [Thermoanaerobaculia bacterium]